MLEHFFQINTLIAFTVKWVNNNETEKNKDFKKKKKLQCTGTI